MREMPALLLVHGSWHGPWCWTKTRDALARRGLSAETVALPSCGPDPAGLGGMDDDARAVADAASALGGDVVVVGHSYGGAVITEAGFGPNVRHLVYLGAFMPDAGRLYVSYFPPGPLPPFVGLRDDGTFEVVTSFARDTFYGDCDEATASAAIASLTLQSQAVLGYPNTRAAWRSIPSTYVVLTQDRVIPEFMQRDFAAQAGTIREMATSHSPMLSQPEALAALLEEIAAAAAPMRQAS